VFYWRGVSRSPHIFGDRGRRVPHPTERGRRLHCSPFASRMGLSMCFIINRGKPPCADEKKPKPLQMCFFLVATPSFPGPSSWWSAAVRLTTVLALLRVIPALGHRTLQARYRANLRSGTYPSIQGWCTVIFFLPHRNGLEGSAACSSTISPVLDSNVRSPSSSA